jgi:hypothetical protein
MVSLNENGLDEFLSTHIKTLSTTIMNIRKAGRAALFPLLNKSLSFSLLSGEKVPKGG